MRRFPLILVAACATVACGLFLADCYRPNEHRWDSVPTYEDYVSAIRAEIIPNRVDAYVGRFGGIHSVYIVGQFHGGKGTITEKDIANRVRGVLQREIPALKIVDSPGDAEGTLLVFMDMTTDGDYAYGFIDVRLSRKVTILATGYTAFVDVYQDPLPLFSKYDFRDDLWRGLDLLGTKFAASWTVAHSL